MQPKKCAPPVVILNRLIPEQAILLVSELNCTERVVDDAEMLSGPVISG